MQVEPTTTLPYWLNEEEWSANPLDGDIMQNMHLDETLKPSIKEWKQYFHWLENIVGYPSAEVKMMKSIKSRQRRVTARLCMFLHFHRAGIPSELIVKGEFGTPAFWRKANRKAWKNASFLYAPRVNKKVDWWCSPDPEVRTISIIVTNSNFYNFKPSLARAPKAKICHRLQTSQAGVDEATERQTLLGIFQAFIVSVEDASKKATDLLEEITMYQDRYSVEPFKSCIKSEKMNELNQKAEQLKEAQKSILSN